jgi:hypothetical protein
VGARESEGRLMSAASGKREGHNPLFGLLVLPSNDRPFSPRAPFEKNMLWHDHLEVAHDDANAPAHVATIRWDLSQKNRQSHEVNSRPRSERRNLERLSINPGLAA